MVEEREAAGSICGICKEGVLRGYQEKVRAAGRSETPAMLRVSHGRSRKRPREPLPAHQLFGLGGVVTASRLEEHKGRLVRIVAVDAASEGRRHDGRESFWADVPLGGLPVIVELSRDRSYDADGRKRIEPLSDDYAPRFGTTMRLAEEVVRLSLEHSYAAVARILQIAGGLPSRILTPVSEWIHAHYVPRLTSPFLALDGVEPYSAMPLTVLGDPVSGRIIDVVFGHDRDTILTWAARADGLDSVRVVSYDMSNMLRTVARDIAPGAIGIVDKRHVLDLKDECVDTVRKELGSRRQTVSGLRRVDSLKEKMRRPLAEVAVESPAVAGLHPRLLAAWQLGDEFGLIYNCPTRKDAEDAFKQWQGKVRAEGMSSEFGRLVRRFDPVVGSWREEFFSYFEIQPRITTSRIEAANGIVDTRCYVTRGNVTPARLRTQLLAHPRLGSISQTVLTAIVRAIGRDEVPQVSNWSAR